MKKSFVFALMLLASATLFSQNQKGLLGHWLGNLVLPQASLRLAITFSEADSGELAAVLTSIDQGGQKVPLDEAVIKNDTLSIRSQALMLSMTGPVSLKDGLWETKFKQATVEAPLEMRKVEKIPGEN